MSNIPTIEEVKEHFKDAVKVQDYTGDTDDYRENEIQWHAGEAYYTPLRGRHGLSLVLWHKYHGYSKIVEYKTEDRTPTIEEVKEHFKDAVKVQDSYNDIDTYREGEVQWSLAGSVYFQPLRDGSKEDLTLILWDTDHGYAEILTRYMTEDRIHRKGQTEKVTIKEILTDTPSERFDDVINHTLDKLLDLLTVKGKEYHRNNNPFHNFDRGAEITGGTREEVLQGFLLKHLISVEDMRNDMKEGKFPTRDKVEEKYNDILVYFLIEKASVLERIDKNETPQ